jgi:Asparagine synthase (glutamine-hydrolyzing)
MSAFAGIVVFGRPVPDHLARLMAALAGEGLDKPVVRRFGQGLFVFRQSCLTPEDRGERQPSVGGDGAMFSMFDGRLDNRAELLAALGLTSTVATPLPDGDLARLAYERWGAEAVPRLLGDFAWALWDGRARRLMLARDHSAHRALFYSRIAGGIAFATGYRPLLALPEVPRDLDDFTVADLLATSPGEDGATVYRHISWVVSAGRVLADADGLRCDRHWLPEPRPVLRLRRDEDYVEAGRDIFEQAVACRLRTIGPVAVALSGGHDSSAIAATAARLAAPATIHGLTMVPASGFDGAVGLNRYADERPYVQALARLYPNLAVDYLSCPPDAPEADPRRLFLDGGTPVRGPGHMAWFAPLGQRARELGARSLIVGDYGNYTFSATGLSRLADLRRDRRWPAFLREMALVRRHIAPALWREVWRSQIRDAFPAAVALYRRWRRRDPAQPPWLRRSALNLDFWHASGFCQRAGREGVQRIDQFAPGGHQRMVGYVTLRSRMQVDAAAQIRLLTGIDYRDPYADRRVMEFCLSLPMDQFMRDGVPRRLSRRLFADHLPAEILAETRRGAQNTDWFLRLSPRRAAIAAELERLQSSPQVGRLLDVPYLRQTLAELPADLAGAQRHVDRYATFFDRALHVARFLHWHDGGNQ